MKCCTLYAHVVELYSLFLINPGHPIMLPEMTRSRPGNQRHCWLDSSGTWYVVSVCGTKIKTFKRAVCLLPTIWEYFLCFFFWRKKGAQIEYNLIKYKAALSATKNLSSCSPPVLDCIVFFRRGFWEATRLLTNFWRGCISKRCHLNRPYVLDCSDSGIIGSIMSLIWHRLAFLKDAVQRQAFLEW